MFWSAQFTVSTSTDWEVHEIFEFLFCHSGTARVLVDKNEVELHPYSMILIVPGARHRVLFEPGQSAVLKVVCVTAQDTARYLSPAQVDLLASVRKFGCTASEPSKELPILADLVKLIPEGSVIGDRRELMIVWNVIGLLLASHANDEDTSLAPVQQRQRNKMHEICTWLDEHLSQEADLDGIAAEFGLSRSLLTRSFRLHTGTSIVHYVNGRRLEKAALLLTASKEQSITEVAFDSGFSNLSNFHRLFKAAYGFTPAEFRRNFTR